MCYVLVSLTLAKTDVRCSNGQGGIVLSSRHEGDQLKILTLVLWGNLKYISITSEYPVVLIYFFHYSVLLERLSPQLYS